MAKLEGIGKASYPKGWAQGTGFFFCLGTLFGQKAGQGTGNPKIKSSKMGIF